MIRKTQLLIAAEKHVSDLMTHSLPKARVFHSLKHTQSVALKCHEMATYYKISTDDTMVLHLAAWFHDVGYCVSSDNHEEHSVQAMRNYLEEVLDGQQVDSIKNIIMATKLATKPKGQLEQIICDADMHHLGSIHYRRWSELLREEIQHYKNVSISDEDWILENIAFFNSHKFFTGYGNFCWNAQKEFNLRAMKEELKKETRSVRQPLFRQLTSTPFRVTSKYSNL